MQKLHVKNVIIGKQYETSENYKKFISIAKDKKIKVNVVEAGVKINIEKDIYFDILWPNSEDTINENVLNNNSLVCKMVYKKFSCIFTGDIEEIAEKAILKKYKNKSEIIKSDVLKIAHHGSKTSSIEEFLNCVKPKIALIGVGENNNFGHPNEAVLKRIEENGSKIYRTDQNGEITIRVNKKGKIWIDKMLN